MAREMAPGVNLYGPTSDTGVTSAPVPQMKHSSKPVSSSGMMRRSITSMPRRLARSITVRRVMPSRKQSAMGVWIAPFCGEEDVGAGAFGDAPLPIEHHGVGVAAPLGAMLGNGADHVEPGGLRLARRGQRIGPPVSAISSRMPFIFCSTSNMLGQSQTAMATLIVEFCAATAIISLPRQATGRT